MAGVRAGRGDDGGASRGRPRGSILRAGLRSSRLIIVVLALLLTGGQASAATPQPRIVGGVDARPGAWPAQVSVRVATPDGVGNCGGTLVSARWVLTAGHCVTEGDRVLPASAFQPVRIGAISRTEGGVEATVDAVVRHPSYSEPSEGVPTFDLALLHLANEVPAVEPAPLIRSDSAQAAFWAPGTLATIVGWGYTQPSGSQSNSRLKQAAVPIVSDTDCANPDDWGTLFNPATMLCAGRLRIDTCSGDSGGPLLVPRLGVFTLVGVTSWGSFPCAKEGVSGVYTRLGDPAINDWVRSHVPTVAFTTAPAVPTVGSAVTFTAVPGPAGGTPAIAWDTDGDGVFDDATGPTTSVVFPSAATYDVAVRAAYPEVSGGDRAAVARDAVAVSDPPPPPPPPAPPPPAPPPPPPGADGRPSATPAARLPNGVGVTSRMRLATLRTTGVRVRFRCERACTLRGRLTLGPVAARRFGLGSGPKSVTIATGRARLTKAGSGTLTLKLTKRAKRALRNRERATISVITTLTAGSETLPGRNPVSVRR